MHEKYGDIFRLDWGSRPTVYICNYEAAIEALESDSFNGRPHRDMTGLLKMFKIDEAGHQTGLSGIGQSWMVLRHFLVAQLEDFEMGKMSVGSMEGVVREEVRRPAVGYILEGMLMAPFEGRVFV